MPYSKCLTGQNKTEFEVLDATSTGKPSRHNRYAMSADKQIQIKFVLATWKTGEKLFSIVGLLDGELMEKYYDVSNIVGLSINRGNYKINFINSFLRL